MSDVKATILAALAGCACALGLATHGIAQTGGAVVIASFKFGPETVTVAANAPITWTNNDGAPHQVVVPSKKLSTAQLSKGATAQLRIAEPGTYDYVCGIHGSMRGKIVVK